MNIIITGSSRGIGLELAKLFCKDNNNTVIGISRTKTANNTIKFGMNSDFIPMEYDISIINNDFKERILTHFDTIDILINNAGYLVNKPFKELTDTDFDNMFTVNVKSVFKIIQQLLPNFSQKSHIVNISSMGGFQGSAKFKGLSLYSSSKGALNTLTECLAEELNENNISINSLCLGAVNTEMLREAFPGYEAPLHANEMAVFIKEFAETAHHYLNGKIIPVSISTP
ncbi:MAG: SDR family NAD(P)-dependent oxidoreductase [Bacteroidetes bacterium]|nr:SDR family NAD(P)-dependent oxidoreductase [Bacteroidota bacterium]